MSSFVRQAARQAQQQWLPSLPTFRHCQHRGAEYVVGAAGTCLVALGVRTAADGFLRLAKVLSPLPGQTGLGWGVGALMTAVGAVGADAMGLPLPSDVHIWGPMALQAGQTWRGTPASLGAALGAGVAEVGLAGLWIELLGHVLPDDASLPDDMRLRRHRSRTVLGGALAALSGMAVGVLGDMALTHAVGILLGGTGLVTLLDGRSI